MADLSSDPTAKLADSESTAKECAEIAEAIAVLRVAYGRYFLGNERQTPSAEHDKLRKRINKLKTTYVRQTALKFRVSSLHNKFLTYERLWVRTIQEMENGTYRRDLFKARLHQKAKSEKQPDRAAAAPPPLPGSGKAAPPGMQPRAAAGGPPPPHQPGQPPISDGKLRAIYDAYVTAKKRCNEDVSKLSYDSLAQTLKKQVPELMKQTGA